MSSPISSLFSRFLPAAIAYGLACVRGDLLYRINRIKRQEIAASIAVILGNQLNTDQISRVVRDFYRLRSCEAMDMARLSGSGGGLVKLVEIRGLQNIRTALANGRGAMLVGAHFGSYQAALSLFGAIGLPITVICRSVDLSMLSNVELLVYDKLNQRPLERHCRPPIYQGPGSIDTAVRAARILKTSELVGALLEPPVMATDRHRAISMDFLGKEALLLPGLVRVAQATEAPVLMFFMRRLPDWRHQILEISAPLPVGEDPLAAFRKMLSIVEKAIRQDPAYWKFWSDRAVLVEMGLLKDTTTLNESD